MELNVALHAFVMVDSDGIRILEKHPIELISFASPGQEVTPPTTSFGYTVLERVDDGSVTHCCYRMV